MIPHRVPFFLPLLYPRLTWRMDPSEKSLYLTFDDGPVPGPTEFALNVLAGTSVKATFFCIGDNIRKHPEVFRAVTAGHHAVGNHTFHHVNGWKTSTEDYIRDVKAFETVAGEITNIPDARLFRPPYGRITRRQIRGLSGYRIIMWDVLSQDYNHSITPERCLRQTLRACREGSVIVFHDSYKARRNMEYVLPRLIDHFAGRGFNFKTL